MRSTTSLLVAVFILVGVYESVVFAGGLIGPPKAVIQKGEWGVGAGYFYEVMDLDAIGVCEFTDPYGTLLDLGPNQNPVHDSWKVKDLKTSTFFADLSYGINNKWEVFVRLGMADASDEISPEESVATEDDLIESKYSLGGRYGFSWGLGTRATLWQKGPWGLGGVAQFMSINSGSSTFSSVEVDETTRSGNIELDFWQVQIALGLTYETNKVCAYAGPLVQWVKGDLDLKYTGYTTPPVEPYLLAACPHDIDEWQIGGFAGVRWAVFQGVDWYAEAQFTGDSWGAGTGLAWRINNKE